MNESNSRIIKGIVRGWIRVNLTDSITSGHCRWQAGEEEKESGCCCDKNSSAIKITYAYLWMYIHMYVFVIAHYTLVGKCIL